MVETDFVFRSFRFYFSAQTTLFFNEIVKNVLCLTETRFDAATLK